MNEFVFTTMRRVFVHFVEEIEDTKKTFLNYLTCRKDIADSRSFSSPCFIIFSILSTKLQSSYTYGQKTVDSLLTTKFCHYIFN